MTELTSSPLPQPGILDIAPYVGGKSTLSGQIKTLKLSSNEGALGPSPNVIVRLKEMSDWHRYPDSHAREVRQALSQRYQLPIQQITCGSGSGEIINFLIQAYAGVGDEVLYSEHGFSLYRISALAHGAIPVTVPEIDLTASVDNLLSAVTDKTKIVFLANPNNPTGSYLPSSEIERLHKHLPSHCLLVIDGAYSEYVLAHDYDDNLQSAVVSKNLIVTRTFSKLYALAGLRLGWMVGPMHVVDVFNRIRGPFNINSAAIAAGVESIKDTEFEHQVRSLNAQQIVRIREKMASIGVTTYPTVGNFILLDFGSRESANAADEFLQSQGIIIRKVEGYGLPTCLRLTIGTADEMTCVIDAITTFMSTSG